MSVLSSASVTVATDSANDTTAEVALVTAPKFVLPSARPRNISELYALLHTLVSRENPDVVLPLSEIKVDDRGLIAIPGHGAFALTDWARKQLASRLGIVWDRWFAHLSGAERAAEINLRLARIPDRMRLRTATFPDPVRGHGVPVLRAFVSETYSTIADTVLAEMLSDVLGSMGGAIDQLAVTDMTVSWSVSVGKPFRPGGDGKVGDIQGGILVRNSGVGYAGLHVVSHMRRLVCLNGMLVPVTDPTLLECIHRGINPDKLRAKLAERAREIGGAFRLGAERLLEGRRHPIADRTEVFRVLLSRAKLPKKQLELLEAAYQQEPEPSVFGIVQAVTRASQGLPPELRYDLERAASGYLAGLGLGG